ncbi:MAG: hypothetical protein CMF58_06105 [Lentimicrobiaceae bacterium]|nr:hypothetical protein [Lentimicrobiaceae bacterium]
MKAIILAAGMGSRLNQITNDMPKALVEVNHIPMLEITLNNLKNQGIKSFLINIHHKGEKVIDFLRSKNNFGVDIVISDERNRLLDTGGAILKAKSFIRGDEPTIVHNVDIISNININDLKACHLKNNNTATLCVRNRKTSRYLLFNDNMELTGWKNSTTGEFRWVDKDQKESTPLAFSGIYIISPSFADNLDMNDRFSIIEAWLQMGKKEKIMAYLDDSPNWFDLGTIERIKTAEKNIIDRENIS